MEKVMTLLARGVSPGVVEGEALVCPKGIGSFGGLDPATGVITEYDNVNRGESVKGRILVMPGSKGSNGWSCIFNVVLDLILARGQGDLLRESGACLKAVRATGCWCPTSQLHRRTKPASTSPTCLARQTPRRANCAVQRSRMPLPPVTHPISPAG